MSNKPRLIPRFIKGFEYSTTPPFWVNVLWSTARQYNHIYEGGGAYEVRTAWDDSKESHAFESDEETVAFIRSIERQMRNPQ